MVVADFVIHLQNTMLQIKVPAVTGRIIGVKVTDFVFYRVLVIVHTF